MDPFAELADEARAAEARRARVQARWLRAQAAEEATLVGMLRDLCEAGTVVALRSRSGRTHRGEVVAVGGDFVQVGDALVRLDAVVAVRTQAALGAPPAAPARDVRFMDVLADVAADRPAVVVVPMSGGDNALRGRLEGVGADVVTITLDGSGDACYVAVAAIAEVVVVG